MPEELEISDGLLISNQGAVFDKKAKTLAIADLHLGYEEVARQDGVYFPKVQKRMILRELLALLDKYKPKTLVINGDLKHNFTRNLLQEWEEIKEIYEAVSKMVEDLRIIKGNHDNFLATILPKGSELPKELRIGRLHFAHGDKALSRKREPGEFLVLAHEHPSVLLRDKLGAGVRLPCFLFHPKEHILILPAFSTLTKGNDTLRSGFLSPILRGFGPSEFKAFAVSEIGLLELGWLADLAGKDPTD